MCSEARVQWGRCIDPTTYSYRHFGCIINIKKKHNYSKNSFSTEWPTFLPFLSSEVWEIKDHFASQLLLSALSFRFFVERVNPSLKYLWRDDWLQPTWNWRKILRVTILSSSDLLPDARSTLRFGQISPASLFCSPVQFERCCVVWFNWICSLRVNWKKTS